MTFECAEEVRLELLIEVGMDFGEGPAKMLGYGDIVHLGQPFVNTDIAEIAVEKAKADGRAVVDGVELGKSLSGKGLETQRHGGVGGGGIERWGWGFVCEEAGKLFSGNGLAVEVTLAKVAAEPEEHVCVSFIFDALGDGKEAEAVAEADDGGGDLSALAGEGHGTDEGGVDLELVEREGLEVAEAGVAGAEVVEGKSGTLLL